jgi:RNA recognition motif. (a.k.a. RRM, RBD, or RNP domain)
MVNDGDTGKPKGYAFIEYEHERDMHGKSCESFMKKKEFTSQRRSSESFWQ